jgi:hypothetical protein
MLLATLEGEFSSLPDRKRALPRAGDYRWRGHRHASVGPPRCWQRTGCAQQRDLAGLAVLGGTWRLGEGDAAAARHGQARTRTGRRADNTHRPMAEERPDAIGRPFAFLCENNDLTLNLFRVAPVVPDRARWRGPLAWPHDPARCRHPSGDVATPSATSPSCGEDRVPRPRLTGRVPATKQSPRSGQHDLAQVPPPYRR